MRSLPLACRDDRCVFCVVCRITNVQRAKLPKTKQITVSVAETRDASPAARAVRPAQATNHNAQAPGPPPPSCGASIGPSIRPVPLRVLSGEERDHTDPPHSLLGTLLFRSHVRSTLEIHSALPPNCSSNSAFAASPITPAGFQSSLLSRCPSWNTSCFSSRPRADLATS